MGLLTKITFTILLSLLVTSCSSLHFSSDMWRGMENTLKVISGDKKLCDYGHPEDQLRCTDRQIEQEKKSKRNDNRD